ncbi:proline-rich receptor-like protein kinase PERK10 [Amborella trichopoda]|uniref:proline-rich receptor-like protein kinase PERK10 n=1 Tax=Amborella trichopoda TaxID=13333 RepID=UPI0005D42EC0|nr:proline-rich receptor-like protein kinase PERK10 [Amborella trichopoda]|eukprot:XP_011624233.1 proline-rich receptor-like protein kinase PERK10 [Amborella trichopoda]
MFFPQLRKKPNISQPSSSQIPIPQTPVTTPPTTTQPIPEPPVQPSSPFPQKRETQMFQASDTDSDVVASSVSPQSLTSPEPLQDMSTFLKNLTKQPELNLHTETQSSDSITDFSETSSHNSSTSSSHDPLLLNEPMDPDPDPIIDEDVRPPLQPEPHPSYGDSSKGFTLDDIPPSKRNDRFREMQGWMHAEMLNPANTLTSTISKVIVLLNMRKLLHEKNSLNSNVVHSKDKTLKSTFRK